MSAANTFPTIVVDGIQSGGVHNGLARIQFMRIDVDGKPQPALEMLIPMNQIMSIAQGMSKIGGSAR